MLEVDLSIFKGFAYVVVLYFDMFCSFMKSGVLNQFDSSSVVDMKSDRSVW